MYQRPTCLSPPFSGHWGKVGQASSQALPQPPTIHPMPSSCSCSSREAYLTRGNLMCSRTLWPRTVCLRCWLLQQNHSGQTFKSRDLTWRQLRPNSTSGKVWRHFWCSPLVGVVLVFSGLQPGLLLKSYKAQESHHKKNYLAPDVNGGSDEKS